MCWLYCICRKGENESYFLKFIEGYLKNHWTNTRLVCTHLMHFLCWVQIWYITNISILRIFEKKKMKCLNCRLLLTSTSRGLKVCYCEKWDWKMSPLGYTIRVKHTMVCKSNSATFLMKNTFYEGCLSFKKMLI